MAICNVRYFAKVKYIGHLQIFLISYSVGHLRCHGMVTKFWLVMIILMNLCGAVVKISSGEREAQGSIPDRSRFFHTLNLVCVSLPVLHIKLQMYKIFCVTKQCVHLHVPLIYFSEGAPQRCKERHLRAWTKAKYSYKNSTWLQGTNDWRNTGGKVWVSQQGYG